jgi:AraC-like DNA-binding protein
MYINIREDNALPPNSLLDSLPTLAAIQKKMMYSRRLGRVWLFIEECYSDPELQLGQVAKHCGINRDYLNVLLHRFVKTTFNNLLSRYRIEKCLELFQEKNYTITEIYLQCGFRSAATFDRQFKKWVGCLPKDYKKFVREMLFEGLEVFEERKNKN